MLLLTKRCVGPILTSSSCQPVGPPVLGVGPDVCVAIPALLSEVHDNPGDRAFGLGCWIHRKLEDKSVGPTLPQELSDHKGVGCRLTRAEPLNRGRGYKNDRIAQGKGN